MDYLLLNAGERLEQMADEMQNSWSSVLTHTINTEVTVLTMTTETDLEKGIRITPQGGVCSDPVTTVFALVLDTEIARFDSMGHYEASD